MPSNSCWPGPARPSWEPPTTCGRKPRGSSGTASQPTSQSMGGAAWRPCHCERRSVSDAVALFERSGALLRGHFTYTSGRHGAEYLEKFRLLEDPKATTALCGMIAARFAGAGVELVAGPTTGGIILAYEVARQLGVRAVYAERGETGGRGLRRGVTGRPGERGLVGDDIGTTGGSVRDMLTCVETARGTVVGGGVLGGRTG